MSRTPKINPALAALDAEIANARQHRQTLEADALRARQLVDALVAARERMEDAGATSTRAARGSVEKAILHFLPPGREMTAEQLQAATGAKASSVRNALARMKAAGTLALSDDDRYSLAGGGIKDAAE